MSLCHDDVSHIVALASSLNLRDIRKPSRFQNLSFSGAVSSLLDALASICVSEEVGEAFAVAVQFLSQNSIRFTFASDFNQTKENIGRRFLDSEKENNIITHVQHVWSLLQTISDRCRVQELDEQGLQNELHVFCEKEIGQLKTAIYTFGYQKFRHRVMKKARWDEFCLFTEIYHTMERQNSVSDFFADLQQFHSFLTVLVHEHLKREDSPGEGFLYLVTGAGILGQRILSRQSNSCEISSTRVSEDRRWMNRDPFPLRDYITKVVALELHINTLLGFSSCLRNREIIVLRPEITHLSNFSYPVSEPSSWDNVLSLALSLGRRRPVDPPKLLQALNSTLPLSSSSQTIHSAFTTYHTLHCEMVLINHFVLNPSPPPLRQLGVSKPTCSACSSYIKASNKSRNIYFDVTRCNGKWYFPWSLSTSDPKILLHQTLADVIEKIMTCLTTRGQVLQPSESDEIFHPEGSVSRKEGLNPG
ncbi:hypothetical protein Clacol_008345 [Clathrus columnatus]|uniref:Uncharacterized protein n=1 Tax=Clathrus columnatus TaxID=1419009 RepID=A0AAV5AKS0_9AGAM|nr:hypothetical protein Clacol_008345 [Clathrus columnatus]